MLNFYLKNNKQTKVCSTFVLMLSSEMFFCSFEATFFSFEFNLESKRTILKVLKTKKSSMKYWTMKKDLGFLFCLSEDCPSKARIFWLFLWHDNSSGSLSFYSLYNIFFLFLPFFSLPLFLSFFSRSIQWEKKLHCRAAPALPGVAAVTSQTFTCLTRFASFLCLLRSHFCLVPFRLGKILWLQDLPRVFGIVLDCTAHTLARRPKNILGQQ